MARYYKYKPQQYESMFVPLPLDLFAAKAQANQQGYDQLVTAKGQIEDEFRNVLALTPDITKRNELINQYKQNFNAAVDDAKGNVDQLYSNLKNLHKDFQTDMAYGHLGAIQQSYTTYNELEKKYQEALQKGDTGEADYYADMLSKFQAWSTSGGTKEDKEKGTGYYTTFNAQGPMKMWDWDKWTDTYLSNWKDDSESKRVQEGNYTWMEKTKGITQSEALNVALNDLRNSEGYDRYANNRYIYAHKGLEQLPEDKRNEVIYNSQIKKLNSDLINATSDKDKQDIQNSINEYQEAYNNGNVERLYQKEWRDAYDLQQVVGSVQKVAHVETERQDLQKTVEAEIGIGKAIEDYKKLIEKDPTMYIPSGLDVSVEDFTKILNTDKAGVSTATWELLNTVNAMGIDLSFMREVDKDGKPTGKVSWDKGVEYLIGFKEAKDPLAYVNSLIPEEKNKLKAGTPEAAAVLNSSYNAAEKLDNAMIQQSIDQQMFNDLSDAYTNDVIGMEQKIDKDVTKIQSKYGKDAVITARSTDVVNPLASDKVVITAQMMTDYKTNGTTGIPVLDNAIKSSLSTAVESNPSKATGFMLEATGGEYDSLAKAYENSINPQNIANFVDMAGEAVDKDFMDAYSSAWANGKVKYTTVVPRNGGKAYIKVYATDEDGNVTSKVLRSDVGDVQPRIQESMAQQIVNDFNSGYADDPASRKLIQSDLAAYGQFMLITPLLEFDSYKEGKENKINSDIGTFVVTKLGDGQATLQYVTPDGRRIYVKNETTNQVQIFADPDAIREQIGEIAIQKNRTEGSYNFTPGTLEKPLYGSKKVVTPITGQQTNPNQKQ